MLPTAATIIQHSITTSVELKRDRGTRMRIHLQLVSLSPCLGGDGDRSSDEVKGDDNMEKPDTGGVV